MINYSLTKKHNPLGEPEDEKVYAVAQRTATWGINQLATHISEHNSKYNRADVEGVLISLVDCLKEQLLDGNSIQLGEFGTFYISLRSKGVSVEELDTYSASNITSVRVAWRRGSIFNNLRRVASFNLVPTRALQKAAVQTMKDNIFGTSTGIGSGGTGDTGEKDEG